MIALAERRRRSLLDVLAVELAPREGRWAAVTRIATGCVVTVAIAMVFQIPQPTYMAYIVFLISKDERAATLTSAIGGLLAVTLAVILTLGLSLIDTAEPALRLPLMAIATFLAMFTSRTFALGPISYLAGFVIVLLQSLVDDVPSPEALTRATLWIGVMILVPVSVTVIVNVLFGQGAALLRERTVRKILKQLAESLASGGFGRHLAEWRSTLAALLETARHDVEKGHAGRITAPAICALLDALVILEAFPHELPEAVRSGLAAKVDICLHAIPILRAVPTRDTAQLQAPDNAGSELPPVLAFMDVLARLHAALDGVPPSQEAAARGAPRPAFVVDAFSNPAYWQFALKTTIAVMLSYSVYTLLDWPGLRTAIVTCFFVALSSLGETVHKLVLRLSGAVIGGLIAGLCIVFVLPQLTDIGQLCMLIGVVAAGAAWVATSSELLSYAGMQIAFAFFLGVLQGYAPATDLTVLRDRIVGILLGNIVVTIIFSTFWPESARSGTRAAMAATLREIGAVMGQTAAEDARTRTVQTLIRADHLHSLSLFELRMLPSHVAAQPIPALADIERLAGAAFVVTTTSLTPYADPDALSRMAQWARLGADRVLRSESLPRVPPMPLVPRMPLVSPMPLASQRGAASTETGEVLAQRAMAQLVSEAQHVASSAP